MMFRVKQKIRRSILAALLTTLTIIFTGCSWSSTPDANVVQVDGTPPIAGGEYTDADLALADGTRLLDTGETERAIDILLQAVKLNPDLAEAWFKLGVAYALVEADVEAALETSVTPTPEGDSKRAPQRKKNSEKAFESAVDAYKKLIAANRDDDVAHFYLGLTYNKLNEDEAAARSLREAVRLKPENVEYQLGLANILMKLAKFADAERALKKALEIEPGNVEAEDLLEKAEAGRKRIDFVPPKRDEKLGASNTSNTNSESDATPSNDKPPTSVTSNKALPANSQTRSTPRPARTPN